MSPQNKEALGKKQWNKFFSRKMSRRKIIGGTAVLGISAAVPFLRFPDSQEFHPVAGYEDELRKSGLVGLAHDATERLPESLKSGASFLEIDVVEHGGHLFAAHDKNWLFSLGPDYEKRELSLILGIILGQGKVPHFDIKFGDKNNSAVNSFVSITSELTSGFIISGKNHYVLAELARRTPAKPFFTVTKQGEFESAVSMAMLDKDKRGVSLKNSLATEENLKVLKDNGIESIVWVVNDPQRALALGRQGIYGISSDNHNLLNALAFGG